MLTLGILESHTKNCSLLIEAFDCILPKLGEGIIILSNDWIFSTTSSTFDELISLRFQLIILSDIAIQRRVRSGNIKWEITILAM